MTHVSQIRDSQSTWIGPWCSRIFQTGQWFKRHPYNIFQEAWVSRFLLHAYWELHRYLCLWQEGVTPCLWSRNTLFPFILAASPLDQGQRVIQRGWDLMQEIIWVAWVVGGLLCFCSPPVVVESGSLGCPPNSTAHRFCVGYKLQKLDPSCGLQITLSCILSRLWELEKTVHIKETVSVREGENRRTSFNT